MSPAQNPLCLIRRPKRLILLHISLNLRLGKILLRQLLRTRLLRRRRRNNIKHLTTPQLVRLHSKKTGPSSRIGEVVRRKQDQWR